MKENQLVPLFKKMEILGTKGPQNRIPGDGRPVLLVSMGAKKPQVVHDNAIQLVSFSEDFHFFDKGHVFGPPARTFPGEMRIQVKKGWLLDFFRYFPKLDGGIPKNIMDLGGWMLCLGFGMEFWVDLNRV